ncbi:MAG: hypothetical protein FWC67_03585 [Defluviitaleaceae bacterium]|nr:hypothetical protein [Defluviitaleaceae bacterium]
MKIEEFWQEFLNATGKDGASSLLAFRQKGENIPQVGEYCIITDWGGSPKYVVETTEFSEDMPVVFEDSKVVFAK